MTSEQIAELRRLNAEATPAPWKPGYSYGADFRERVDQELGAAARNVLPRLLDEREALLKALREAAFECRPVRDLPGYHTYQEGFESPAADCPACRIREAIAKAESP